MDVGEKIRLKRLECGFSQKELANNVCTQATISNIEQGKVALSFFVAEKIAQKLKMSISELYSANTENHYVDIFDDIVRKIECGSHKEAYYLLNEKITEDNIESLEIKKKFYYYKGITEVIGFNNYGSADKNFEKVLSIATEKDLEYVLAIAGKAVNFTLQNKISKASEFFELALNLLDNSTELELKNIKEVARVMYNSAKFFSDQGNHFKAINLCSRGIDLLKQIDSRYYLAYLHYELAFDLYEIGHYEDSTKNYLSAYFYSSFDNLDFIVELVKSKFREKEHLQLDVFVKKLIDIY
ncbi:helix-turn-helix domain-containing protein [Carnobacterium divergens]|uniref:helix-turn-helix domain-containing protein n=1 Tax=Carnobacterium divergens TaxID=2748 RepID=UPI0039AED095